MIDKYTVPGTYQRRKPDLFVTFFCILLLCFSISCETATKKHPTHNRQENRQPVVITNGDYSKLDYDTIYQHISALLDVENKKLPFYKLLKRKNVYSYRIISLCKFVEYYNEKYALNGHESLKCQKLNRLFDEKIKLINGLSGLNLYPHPEGTIVYRFVVDDRDIDSFFDSPLVKRYFPWLLKRRTARKTRVKENILYGKGVIQTNTSSGTMALDTVHYKATLAVHVFFNLMNVSTPHSYNTLNSMFLEATYKSVLDFYPGSVIPGTILSKGENITKTRLTQFDKVLLKTVYSDEVKSGTNLKEAAKIIAGLVYKELRRHKDVKERKSGDSINQVTA